MIGCKRLIPIKTLKRILLADIEDQEFIDENIKRHICDVEDEDLELMKYLFSDDTNVLSLKKRLVYSYRLNVIKGLISRHGIAETIKMSARAMFGK